MVCELSIEGFDGWDPDIEACTDDSAGRNRDNRARLRMYLQQAKSAGAKRASRNWHKQTRYYRTTRQHVSSGLICQETRAAGSEPRTKPSETQTLQGNTSNESLLTSSTSEALLFRYDSVIMLPAATCTNVQSRLNTKVKLDLVCSVIGSTA